MVPMTFLKGEQISLPRKSRNGRPKWNFWLNAFAFPLILKRDFKKSVVYTCQNNHTWEVFSSIALPVINILLRKIKYDRLAREMTKSDSSSGQAALPNQEEIRRSKFSRQKEKKKETLNNR